MFSQVTLAEIVAHMRGPLAEGEDSGVESSGDEGDPNSPVLPTNLRVDIPTSSLRYILIHHLNLNYKYTKKAITFKNPMKRHRVARKFIIEMDRALKMQDATWDEAGVMSVNGEYVIVFTDETKIHQNHSPGTSWVNKTREVGKTTSKGKRLIVLHAITMGGFVSLLNVDGEGIEEHGLTGSKEPAKTAEWIWKANKKFKDHHENMDGAGFEWWLNNRLVPAVEFLFPGKKMILVMDNASYHQQHNTDFYPEKKTPSNASKGLNAHVLRMAGCTEIKIQRGEREFRFEMPSAERAGWAAHRAGTGKAPKAGEEGTVYERHSKGNGGPSSVELAAATTAWLKAKKPEALDSKVEKLFREKDWEIIWTPPYKPKFQPSELVWGVAKQRAGTLDKPKSDLKATKRHLRRGFYEGKGIGTARFKMCNVWGCWKTAEREMNRWISFDKECNGGKGVEGSLGALIGAENWTKSPATCLSIDDMDVEGVDGHLADELTQEERDFAAARGATEEQESDIQVAAAHLGGQDNAEEADESAA